MIKRVDIKTGYLCNNNCFFCAQGHNKKFGNKTNEEIRKDLEDAKQKGVNEVVFTGGEVTIRKDLFDLIRYAKSLGFIIIQLQTNGRAFYYSQFCKDAIEAGANEFGLALHGPKAEVHDYLTQTPGSFIQTTTGMRNLKKLGQKVIMNSVIVKPNYRHAPETAKLFVEIGVDQFQLAFVHGCGSAEVNYDAMMPFVSLAAPYMHKALQIGLNAGIVVMAEAMPYCVMKGYEKCVSELYIPRAMVKERGYDIADFENIRKDELKRKFPQCKECKYDLICEGPWKEYPEHKGHTEFVAVPGEKIKSNDEILKQC